MKTLIIHTALFLFFYIGFSQQTEKRKYTNQDIPCFKIHYLGHSAFVLQFDNDITVVTDYGHFNAWYPSWDSPIYDIGDLVPDIMTFSHFHDDHYDPDRIPDGVDYILTELDSIEIDGLKITPIRVCESNINTEDNTAFLFRYKGMKFLHLGDAQAQIMAIEDFAVQAHMAEIIPDSLDLFLMPIEGMQQYKENAEIFLDLLQPKRFIPMHYWSIDYKQEFLDYLEAQNDSDTNYEIINLQSSYYEINQGDSPDPIKVISLVPSPFSEGTVIDLHESTIKQSILFQNYPNPFIKETIIEYYLPSDQQVKLILFDSAGREISVLVNSYKKKGKHSFCFYEKNLKAGVYVNKLISEKSCLTNLMVLKK